MTVTAIEPGVSGVLKPERPGNRAGRACRNRELDRLRDRADHPLWAVARGAACVLYAGRVMARPAVSQRLHLQRTVRLGCAVAGFALQGRVAGVAERSGIGSGPQGLRSRRRGRRPRPLRGAAAGQCSCQHHQYGGSHKIETKTRIRHGSQCEITTRRARVHLAVRTMKLSLGRRSRCNKREPVTVSTSGEAAASTALIPSGAIRHL